MVHLLYFRPSRQRYQGEQAAGWISNAKIIDLKIKINHGEDQASHLTGYKPGPTQGSFNPSTAPKWIFALKTTPT